MINEGWLEEFKGNEAKTQHLGIYIQLQELSNTCHCHNLHQIRFYFILKNLVLWARSEIDGSALEFCV